VIEHLEDDRRALLNIRSVLAPRGRAIILVPQGQWNFGTLDTVLGHQRRYSKVALAALARHSGFEATHILEFNRFGTAAWFFEANVFGRRPECRAPNSRKAVHDYVSRASSSRPGGHGVTNRSQFGQRLTGQCVREIKETRKP